MARLIEFFSADRRARPRPVRRRRRDAARRGHRPRAAAGPRHRARPALGRRLRGRRRATCRPSATARGRCIADLGPADPGGPRPFDPSGFELRRRRRGRGSCRPSQTGSVDFVATDPPYNLQLPLTMAGGTLAETHANRRTDYAMVTDSPDGPRQRRRLPGVPRPDGRIVRRARGASCARAATPWSSSATRTRTGATCSPAPTWRRGPRPSGLVPKGDLIWYQAGTRLRPYGYPRAFVPNIAHQHILVLRNEAGRPQPRGGGATRGRPSRTSPSMSDSPIVQVSAAIGIVAVGGSSPRAHVADDVAEGHLVDPALPPSGPGRASRRRTSRGAGPRRPGRGTPISVPRSSSGESSRRTTRVADRPAARGRRAGRRARGRRSAAGRRRSVADRVGLAGLEERRAAPARQQRFGVLAGSRTAPERGRMPSTRSPTATARAAGAEPSRWPPRRPGRRRCRLVVASLAAEQPEAPSPSATTPVVVTRVGARPRPVKVGALEADAWRGRSPADRPAADRAAAGRRWDRSGRSIRARPGRPARSGPPTITAVSGGALGLAVGRSSVGAVARRRASASRSGSASGSGSARWRRTGDGPTIGPARCASGVTVGRGGRPRGRPGRRLRGRLGVGFGRGLRGRLGRRLRGRRRHRDRDVPGGQARRDPCPSPARR